MYSFTFQTTAPSTQVATPKRRAVEDRSSSTTNDNTDASQARATVQSSLSPSMAWWSPTKRRVKVTPIQRKFDFTLPPDSVDARATYNFLCSMHHYEGDYESARRQQRQQQRQDELETSLFGTSAAPSSTSSILSSQVISTPEEDSVASSTDLPPVLEAEPSEAGPSVSGDEVEVAEEADVPTVNDVSEAASSETGSEDDSEEDDPNLLPFPTDQLRLVQYMGCGLSIRNLFPASGSEEAGGIICRAELKMINGHWLATPICGDQLRTDENYQRHVKAKHLGCRERGSLQYLAETKWGYGVDIPRLPNMRLRVREWDRVANPFPALAT